jgi:hypothetical protein
MKMKKKKEGRVTGDQNKLYAKIIIIKKGMKQSKAK